MYAEDIDIAAYKYKKTIIITETAGVSRTNLPVLIRLDYTNFNFNLVKSDGSDIRFSERQDGYDILLQWVPIWDSVNYNGVIWINLPSLNAYETKTLYVFFGDSYALLSSNIYDLGFLFAYSFDYSKLDTSVWSGSTTSTYNSLYGYSLDSKAIQTITNPLENLNSWECYAYIYVVNKSSTNYWGHYFSFVGSENDASFVWRMHDMYTNMKTGADVYYTDESYSVESASFNEHWFAYYEPTDSYYFGLDCRKSLPDTYTNEERIVDGNTRHKNILIQGNYYNDKYIKWIVVSPFTRELIQINLDDLYISDGDYSQSVLIESEAFSEDFVNSLYYHESSCGGDAYNLSNNNVNTSDSVWYSNVGSVSGYVLIDFSRRLNDDKVSRQYIHYDSGHISFYNASKLSDHGIDAYNRNYWSAEDTSGWACINFGSQRFAISCLGLKALSSDLNRMAKNIKFQGGYEDPRFDDSAWVDLYEGTCFKTQDWQYFYFVNNNIYKYYKLTVSGTYGSNLAIADWCMYETIPENFNGKLVTQLRLRPITFDSGENYFPKNIYFYGSNNGVSWDVLISNRDTNTPYHNTFYERWQRYSFSNSKYYRMYKLSMSTNWEHKSSKLGISEWEMVCPLEEQIISRNLYGNSEDFMNIWSDIDTTFQNGWLYLATSAYVEKLHNYNLVEHRYVNYGAWRFARKIIIHHDYIDEDLTQFPLLLKLSTSSGRSGQDFSLIFTVLGAEYKKLAVFSGTEQLYVEVEEWDYLNQTATLWVSKSGWVISKDYDTTIWICYDINAEDNTQYIGLPGSRPEVWDSFTTLRYDMGQLLDSTENSNDATKGTGLTVGGQTGLAGKATYFSGATTNYLSCKYTALNGLLDFTVGVWVKSSRTSAGQAILSGANSHSINEFILWPTSSAFAVFLKETNHSYTMTNAFDNSWHQLVWERDVSNNFERLFRDGVVVGSGVPVSRSALSVSSGGFIVAQEQDSVGGGFDAGQSYYGTLDELRVSNITRSEAWVKAEYYNMKDQLISYDPLENINDIITLV